MEDILIAKSLIEDFWQMLPGHSLFVYIETGFENSPSSFIVSLYIVNRDSPEIRAGRSDRFGK